MLNLVNLSCARGDRTLFSDANLTLRPGQALYVAGSNGTGKTSLLRLISGLAAPEHGEVLWNDTPIRKLREEFARDLLYLGHAAALKDELTSVENLKISAAISGRHISESDAILALRMFGLRGREDLFSRSLSAGQRRKVNLARLLLPDPPKLWVLDEPFTALDARAVIQLAEVIARHLHTGGIVIYTTHQDVDFPDCSISRLTIEGGKVTLC